jgi:hypothetical protein
MSSATSSDDRLRIEREVRARAVRRVRAKVGLYWHVLCFVLVNAALVAINLHYTPERSWFVWPLAGWGAALLMHAFAVLQRPGLHEDMVEAEVRRELARRGLT